MQTVTAAAFAPIGHLCSGLSLRGTSFEQYMTWSFVQAEAKREDRNPIRSAFLEEKKG